MSSLAKDKSGDVNSNKAPKLQLEREGRRQIEQIVEHVKAVPVGVKLIQVAWTAGPVSFLALQGGYLFAYGHLAPIQHVFYFVTYTCIAGIASLAITAFYDHYLKFKQKLAHKNVVSILDKLPDLIIATRNLRIGSMEGYERRIESSAQILNNPNASPSAVRLAVKDITLDPDLAESAEYIEVLRREGLHSRIREVYNSAFEKANEAYEALKEVSENIANRFRNRMLGKAPTLQAGLPRRPGFIGRVLSAAEEDNEALMTPKDAIDLFVLTFELLCGREFTLLKVRYKGRKALTLAANELEIARSNYKVSSAVFTGRIKAMMQFLNQTPYLKNTELGANELTKPQRIYLALQSFSNEIEKNRVSLGSESKIKIEKFRNNLQDFSKALRLYSSLYKARRDLLRSQNLMIKAWRRWQDVSKPFRTDDDHLQTGRDRLRFSIQEQNISLSDKKKLKMAKEMVEILEDIDIRRVGQYLIIRSQDQEQQLTMQDIKRLTIDIAVCLNKYVDIALPDVQLAIDSTAAANLGALELGFSADAKAGWGSSSVKEVQSDVGKTAEHLAKMIVEEYAVELDEGTQEFLQKSYGANPKVLAKLKPPTKRAKFQNFIINRNIPSVTAPDRNWAQCCDRAQSHLKRL